MRAQTLRTASTFLVSNLGLFLFPVAAEASEGFGPRFQVSTDNGGSNFSAAVDSTPSGELFVVWTTNLAPGSVQAQRFDASGEAIGAQIQVSTSPVFHTIDASVGVDDSGAAFVVWGRTGRRFDTAGNPIGGEFEIGSSGFGAAVDVAGDGSAMVVWSISDSRAIHGMRYDSSGAPTGAEFQVSTTTLGFKQHARVSIAPDGGAFVAWESAPSPIAIRGQRYDPSGAAAGGELLISPTTDIVGLDVDHGPSGEFLVVWEHGGQKFDASATPIGSPLPAIGPHVEVAASPLGEFVVVWQETYGGIDGYFFIRGQRWDAAGGVVGGEFFVAGGPSLGGNPSIAYDGSDRYVVVWDVEDQSTGLKRIFGVRSGFLDLPALSPPSLLLLAVLALGIGALSLRSRRWTLDSHEVGPAGPSKLD